MKLTFQKVLSFYREHPRNKSQVLSPAMPLASEPSAPPCVSIHPAAVAQALSTGTEHPLQEETHLNTKGFV